jgi:hypothetical protein
MLDLVSYNQVAYLARQASVGVNPANDQSMTYWQPFGSVSGIATTSEPGLVMPDGTTITVDATGLISANLGIADLNDITFASLSDGHVLIWDATASKWKNADIASDADDISYDNTTSGLQGSNVQDAIDEVSSQMQTLETALGDKVNTSDIANNLTTTTEGKVLDATQGKALNDSISTTNTAITNKHKVKSVQVTTSGWTADTTSQSGSTLYKKSIALNHVYVDSPSVDIGSTGVLPTTAQQDAYNLLQYVTVDSAIPCLYLYASNIPSTSFYINVEGVD